MKKSELQEIIREEIKSILNEAFPTSSSIPNFDLTGDQRVWDRIDARNKTKYDNRKEVTIEDLSEIMNIIPKKDKDGKSYLPIKDIKMAANVLETLDIIYKEWKGFVLWGKIERSLLNKGWEVDETTKETRFYINKFFDYGNNQHVNFVFVGNHITELVFDNNDTYSPFVRRYTRSGRWEEIPIK